MLSRLNYIHMETRILYGLGWQCFISLMISTHIPSNVTWSRFSHWIGRSTFHWSSHHIGWNIWLSRVTRHRHNTLCFVDPIGLLYQSIGWFWPVNLKIQAGFTSGLLLSWLLLLQFDWEINPNLILFIQHPPPTHTHTPSMYIKLINLITKHDLYLYFSNLTYDVSFHWWFHSYNVLLR